MRRLITVLAALMLAAAGLLVGPAAQASATACPTGWGSLPEVSSASGDKPLVDIRTGRHDCYDRMVFDVRDTASAGPIGYHVRYVDQVYQDGSGNPVPVTGGAVIELRIAAPSYDPETGQPTYGGTAGQPLPGVTLAGYQTFRDARFAGSFEGTTQVALGVRARLPFRVFQWSNHLVVDVAHTWTGGTGS